MEEDKKRHILKISAIVVLTFVTAFIAFYTALVITLNKVTNPLYNARQIDRMIQKHEKEFAKFEEQLDNHPFMPKTRPMLVNLAKENSEYKIIVDLKPLDGNEDDVEIKIKDNVVSIKGEIENSTKRGEEILSFSQAYYLDEKLLTDKITKEKRGDRYIITIPFKNN